MERSLDIVPGYYTGNSSFVQAYLETYKKLPPWDLKPGVLEEVRENQKRFGPIEKPENWLK